MVIDFSIVWLQAVIGKSSDFAFSSSASAVSDLSADEKGTSDDWRVSRKSAPRPYDEAEAWINKTAHQERHQDSTARTSQEEQTDVGARSMEVFEGHFSGHREGGASRSHFSKFHDEDVKGETSSSVLPTWTPAGSDESSHAERRHRSWQSADGLSRYADASGRMEEFAVQSNFS